MEQPIVSAVTSDVSEAKVTVSGVRDRPGVAAAIFRGLAEHAVNIDMIVQISAHSGVTDISFTVPRTELDVARSVAEAVAPELGAEGVSVDDEIAQVSLVGAGMKTHPGVTATMFEALAKENINVEMISTSPIRISCTVRESAVDDAVRVLHEAFGLAG